MNLARAQTQMPEIAKFRLLVVDDEPDLRTLYELTLLREGYEVEAAASVDEAWHCLTNANYDAVITDMRLTDGSGLDLLRRLDAAGRNEKIVVITAYGSAENAVEALKAGAFDYLTKPVDLRQFRHVIASALGRVVSADRPAIKATTHAEKPSATAAVTTEPLRSLAAPASEHPALRRLIGASAPMQQVRALIERVARGMAPVMVQGESGTGKELVARAIHEVSSRSSQPFVAVNCGAIPEQLLEAEFFGYRKGSFTGAKEDREGFFQAAHGGTLFLDEIGDLPLAMQTKLLRAIQERSVRPIGAVAELPVNARIVSATHKDLNTEVHQGRFRQDLYYRLNVIQIRLPPLRERMQDLSAICDAALERISRDADVSPRPGLSGESLAHLARYSFPGNVRELENLLHRAVAMSGASMIEPIDLGLTDEAFDDSAWHGLDAPGTPASAAVLAGLPADLVVHLDQVERDILAKALERHRFNRTAAGASLGLSLRQMRYRMARLGIQAGDHVGEGPDAAADSRP